MPFQPGTPSLLRQPFSLVLIVGLLATIFYLSSFLSITEIPSGRTFQGRFLGIVGFFLILGALFQSVRGIQRGRSLEARSENLHLPFGVLTVWLILLHAGSRFFNGVATLAFVFLVAVSVSGMIIDSLLRKQAPEGKRQANTKLFSRIAEAQTRRAPSLQRWLHIYFVLTVGLLTLCLVHILSVLYY